LWLGHADIRTTEVYLRMDPSEKLEAVEAVVPPELRRGRFKAPDALIASLLRTNRHRRRENAELHRVVAIRQVLSVQPLVRMSCPGSSPDPHGSVVKRWAGAPCVARACVLVL